MNLLPIEIYLVLAGVIPLGVCFAKWKFAMNWKVAFILCAGLSWIYFNLWMAKLDPPDNGFANFVYLVSGWFWLLPIFAILFVGFRLTETRASSSRGLKVASVGFNICAGITAVIVLWNLVGRMSAERAVTQARIELEERGYKPTGREIPSFEDGHWIIRYPDSDFGEIRLTRNGRMSWIGGPG
ncbi:MAG: hypothetical protein KDK99_06270 [Verrucomicrobiales bacterium]|nr:hypothetical protein [Verrucomicrobiales bacterium]